MRIGAVVVNYDAGPWLEACVASLASEGVDQVVVADNGSTDDSLVRLGAGGAGAAGAAGTGLRVLRLRRNRGYGAAANRAVEALGPGPDAVLVCNPDLVLEPGAVKSLAAALEADPTLGIVGPRLENLDGTLYPSARSFPSLVDSLGHGFLGLVAPGNRFTRRYRMLDWDHATARRVDWVSGACLLARRQAWDDLGGFDESFFMYLEDVDLCWRAGRLGWGVAYEPAATVAHVQGVSTGRHPYRMILAHHRSILRFAARTAEGRRRVLLPVVAAGLVARAALACAHHRLGRPTA